LPHEIDCPPPTNSSSPRATTSATGAGFITVSALANLPSLDSTCPHLLQAIVYRE
jgi:hypothetical protein